MTETATNEHPIPFSGSMVRAVLEGRKTQMRRVIKPQPINFTGHKYIVPDHAPKAWHDYDGPFTDFCPYGAPGDRLIVRESWRYHDWTEDGYPQIQYKADDELRWIDPIDAPSATIDKIHEQWAALSDDENFAREGAARDKSWRPSIHMFHCFSRISLVVKRRWVERVQEISNDDAWCEGVSPSPEYNCRAYFRDLWDSINASKGYGWDANPWVWCVEFERIEVK